MIFSTSWRPPPTGRPPRRLSAKRGLPRTRIRRDRSSLESARSNPGAVSGCPILLCKNRSLDGPRPGAGISQSGSYHEKNPALGRIITRFGPCGAGLFRSLYRLRNRPAAPLTSIYGAGRIRQQYPTVSGTTNCPPPSRLPWIFPTPSRPPSSHTDQSPPQRRRARCS